MYLKKPDPMQLHAAEIGGAVPKQGALPVPINKPIMQQPTSSMGKEISPFLLFHLFIFSCSKFQPSALNWRSVSSPGPALLSLPCADQMKCRLDINIAALTSCVNGLYNVTLETNVSSIAYETLYFPQQIKAKESHQEKHR